VVNIENTEHRLDRSREGLIRAFFKYDRDTGVFTWRDDVSRDWYKYEGAYQTFLRERAGRVVDFYKTPKGYLQMNIAGESGIFAHQIAWLLTYEEMPKNHIDHIDGNPENNVINNLRDVSNKINQRNRKMNKNNTSGFNGVHWNNKCKKWVAHIVIDNRMRHLGVFTSAREAALARQVFVDGNTHLGFTDRHGKAFDGKTDTHMNENLRDIAVLEEDK